ncbi:MAG: Fe-S protein assembly chaperone HscA [Saprospiraceae bacterium]|nr:Fe-S protein assembly chaperone HscA [Saprospiraceae bacterium]
MISINIKDGSVEPQSPNAPILGIDLGTTNSLVAYIKDGKPIVIQDAENKTCLVPSAIYFDQSGKIIVGTQAKDQYIENPETTILSVKRLLGRSFEEISAQEIKNQYTIFDQGEDKMVKLKIYDRFYSPVELSALILGELKNMAENHLGCLVSRVVITVPAYFNDAQRQATRDAGKLAGLDVLRVVNEPTAAALAYGLNNEEDQTIMVYDLGGGTFDISILRIQEGTFEVLSTCGDTQLGGDDIDQAIAKFWNSTNPNIPPSHLVATAQRAKKEMKPGHTFRLSDDDYELELSYEKYKEICSPLIDKTISFMSQALRDAKLDIETIHKILLVGGSTRIPFIEEAITERFGIKPSNELNPDEVVAIGAAVQADILAGASEFLLMDITPLSLGIETVGGLMDVILPRNSKIPASVGRNYTTSKDGQTQLKISVFQGERDLIEDNRKLGEFILKGIPPMPAGLPKIEISFMVNADCILKVRAKELRSGVTTEVLIKTANSLSEEEMGKMLLESIQHAKEDQSRKALIEARVEAAQLLLSTQKFYQENKNILSKSELEQLAGLMSGLEKLSTETNPQTIHLFMESMNMATRPMAERILDINISQALKGTSLSDTEN